VTPSDPGPLPELIAVAHGTDDEAGRAELTRLVETVAALRPELVVRLAYLERGTPSVGAVLAELSGRPAVVLPLLLTAASHSKTDLAASVRQARAGGARLAYGRPFGAHPRLLTALADRLHEAGVAPDAPVVLAAAGSRDPAANAELVALGRLLSESRGLADVETAFASATRPTVPEALDRLQRLGTPRAAVGVVPYFLAPGHFAGRVVTDAWGAVVTAVLGAHPEVARLVVERYDEALTGDIRMNCDVCIYRSAVGGRADAVGAPQRPHVHTDDA
jgi:sirohydrochlorin cobaltochelatase